MLGLTLSGHRRYDCLHLFLTCPGYELLHQSASADWFSDILRHTYDDALCIKGIKGGADGVFICAGMLRGDSIYGPGMKHLSSFESAARSMDSDASIDRISNTWRRSRDPPVRGSAGSSGNQWENVVGDIGSVFVYLACSRGVST